MAGHVAMAPLVQAASVPLHNGAVDKAPVKGCSTEGFLQVLRTSDDRGMTGGYDRLAVLQVLQVLQVLRPCCK